MTPEVVCLTLYYREGCHLCQNMLQALRGLQSRLGFELTLVDIDRVSGLRQRYDEWVPVLCHGDRELCHYHLDEQAVRDACC
ncbi:MAG: glutaredoxin family protein [Thiogranum sp.]|nr:glutaredoxin family protein [Thiogranum sp.]